MEQNADYKKLLTELLKRQISILGVDFVSKKVSDITGLKVDTEGNVIDIQGDANQVFNQTADRFVNLSGSTVKTFPKLPNE